jgi:hypothetical protein
MKPLAGVSASKSASTTRVVTERIGRLKIIPLPNFVYNQILPAAKGSSSVENLCWLLTSDFRFSSIAYEIDLRVTHGKNIGTAAAYTRVTIHV